MAFVEDLTGFLGDFGLPVVAGGVSGLGILDMPGEYVGEGDLIISTDYTLRCIASEFGTLEYGDAVTVNGMSYLVRDNRLVDDGAFCLVQLSKIAADLLNNLLLEDGSNLLLEDGSLLLLEA